MDGHLVVLLPAWLDARSLAAVILTSYLILSRSLRFRRMRSIEAPFVEGKRPLSTMSIEEANRIINELQRLEFPSAFAKARKMALLKAGAIPTMSKLFAATGQNTRKTAGRRAVDTEILLREMQTQPPRTSQRYALAVARVNYLHARYRRAGKITDRDMLHTLGDGLAEILNTVDGTEWRRLTDVERCALGVFHRALGEDLGVDFDELPSAADGWTDGMHFARELVEWTVRYEEEVAVPTPASTQYVMAYVDSAFSSLPKFVGQTVRKMLGHDLDDVMRTSLGLEKPGIILRTTINLVRGTQTLILRHLCLPRPSCLAATIVQEKPNASGTTVYNFERFGLQPWYMKPSASSTWGPAALFLRLLGARTPGSRGDYYKPQGYDLWTIGPEPQFGKGKEDMESDANVISSRGVGCPFSQRAALTDATHQR